MKRDHIERSPKIYLSEILEFIDKIDSYTRNLTYEKFSKDLKTIDAVDANLRNIGEAVRVLTKHKLVKELFYRYHVPYVDLTDIRTDLTHEYFSTNPQYLWKTIQTLITLRPQFKKVLDEFEAQAKKS